MCQMWGDNIAGQILTIIRYFLTETPICSSLEKIISSHRLTLSSPVELIPSDARNERDLVELPRLDNIHRIVPQETVLSSVLLYHRAEQRKWWLQSILKMKLHIWVTLQLLEIRFNSLRHTFYWYNFYKI